MTRKVLKKFIKLKKNLLLSTKLIIFLNYDEIGNWVYYIRAEGVVYIGYVVVVVKREYILQAKYS